MRGLMYTRRRADLYKELGIPDRMDPDFSQAPKVAVIGTLGVSRTPIEAPVFAMNALAARMVRHPGATDVSRRRSHRVWVICPGCDVAHPLGRINQHYLSGRCRKEVVA